MPKDSADRDEAEHPTPTGVVQLRLLPGGSVRPDWVLDERTRTVGRQGVAVAREILRRVAPPDGARQAS